LGHSLTRKLSVAALAALCALAVAAPASIARGAHNVVIAGSTLTNYHFKPGKLTIGKGQTVDWSWSSNAPHNVTFSKLGKHSATGAAETYSLKFKKTGTFRYHCTIHGFKGKIVVK
jgi:plastocyanin